jgi:hypothetical protein
MQEFKLQASTLTEIHAQIADHEKRGYYLTGSPLRHVIAGEFIWEAYVGKKEQRAEFIASIQTKE